ncbi:hypothetical protein D8682_00940 (plasmid) [Buttiauxella sp. 3AFRM03]|uniref:hypothetical protein n=1 Tax=Buttiauxella sp. 3AFRM03 TaxID=2479367 RepID=UPI000EF81930|nr:hypothetical protein [Buttiauxella sp. 3AFRM03]AYN25680.1 hypothetical protein D8682_00940 [Buttiauxella sp. 3AFRM03]
MKNLLEFEGSLLKDGTFIVSPYDLSKSSFPDDIEPLTNNSILNQSFVSFSVDYSRIAHLVVINGMGVTLGDSIIGISILDVIKKLNENIKISVIRPASAPKYVDEVYLLASDVIDEVFYMPFDVNDVTGDVIIDIGNQLYRPEFHTMEMHDFFYKYIGLDSTPKVISLLNNSWLKNVPLDNVFLNRYVLFSPLSSTKIRSIPEQFYFDIVDALAKKTGKQVVGFVDVEHPKYRNVLNFSKSTKDFVSIIKNAEYVYTCDSATLHIAAAFNIPTQCIFNTIKPELRVKYYNNIESVYIGDELLTGVQNSDDKYLLEHVKFRFKENFHV